MADNFSFRPTRPYTSSPSLGGLRHLVARSAHVDALERLGALDYFADFPVIGADVLDEGEARHRLLALPATTALLDALVALDDALDGPGSPIEIEALITAGLEVLGLPRPVRKAEFIVAAKTLIAAPSSILAGVLRAAVGTARTIPSVAELRTACDAERVRLVVARGRIGRIKALRDEAVIAMCWRGTEARQFLDEVGDGDRLVDSLDDTIVF